MLTLLSVVTAVKDYIEVVHKLVETNSSNSFEVLSYTDSGAIVTYIVMSIKELFISFITFKWLQNLTLLPFIVPNVASAMISEISILDGYFHNAFSFLETPISYGNQNFLVYGVEKFSIGLINSLFLCLPTSVAHIITLRRFVMQGLEAGYLAGLGTIAGNLLWISSIIFGLRFIVIPWLSLDLLRYGLGTLLLVKYMWDSYSERRTVLEDLSKKKIFLLNFLLAFTEQATVYPFVSNLSIGSDATILETFPTSSFFEYSTIHLFYLGGLFVGSLSLLQLTCWFWENPAFNIYMWAMSSLKVTNGLSQSFINVFFLYLTMLFSVANLSYFGLDYTIANPLGLVHEDRLLDQKGLLETSFLNTKASDRNTRRNRGRHGRRERWKRRVRRYRTFDASLYDQGVYDLFTIEDLNYGFDRFWLRRKIRNHRVRFRFFPGPWMRSFKKQLAKPRLESFMGPRVEFFRILFEQSYHPEFHEFRESKDKIASTNSTSTQLKMKTADKKNKNQGGVNSEANLLKEFKGNTLISYYSDKNEKIPRENLIKEHSALRKFIRKAKTRTKAAEVLMESNLNLSNASSKINVQKNNKNPIYAKRWKQIFSKIAHGSNQKSSEKGFEQNFFKNFYNQTILTSSPLKVGVSSYFKNTNSTKDNKKAKWVGTLKQNSEKQLSQKDRQILRYRTFLSENRNEMRPDNMKTISSNKNLQVYEPMTLLHPIQFYVQKEQAFQKKMKFYGASLYRNFGIENNAPYYRIMMKKFFYYYKPTLRWERTMRTSTMRKARRKGPRVPRKLNVNKQTQMLAKEDNRRVGALANSDLSLELGIATQAEELTGQSQKTKIQKPTHFYSLVSKRATRYRYQIYKDVLQHWYYSPFNRLLLKLDVDAFIRRQPNTHFLTKKEENLLHLKRFLLSDYYNTLRWYSSMEHYDSMKKKIGKTKSFANQVYNQQFFGTFKKVRHLFAITPSLSDNTVLKFDQPLFNEYSSLSGSEKLRSPLAVRVNKNGMLLTPNKMPSASETTGTPTEKQKLLPGNSVALQSEQQRNSELSSPKTTIHEELLADNYLYGTSEAIKDLPKSLTNQSTTILKEYLKEAQPARQDYIRKLLEEKNYIELTNFLFKGKKIRGTKPMTNENIFIQQEGNLFVPNLKDKTEFENISSSSDLFTGNGMLKDPRYTWIALMQRSKNMIYNQEALKNYVQNRVEKMEKRKKREEKAFKSRLDNIKKWVSLETATTSSFAEKNNLTGLRTSVQKSIKEGLYDEMVGGFSGKNLEKSNLRNNREMVLQNFSNYLSTNNQRKPILTNKILPVSAAQAPNTNQNFRISQQTKNISIQLKSHLSERIKLRALETFEAEKNLKRALNTSQQILKQSSSVLNRTSNLLRSKPSILSKIMNQTLTPFQWVSKKVVLKVENIYSLESTKKVFQPLRTALKFFTRNKNKSLDNWKKRETVLSTRKKIRRKIYRVLDQKKQSQKNSNTSELEKFMDKQNLEPARQKEDFLNKVDSFQDEARTHNKKTWRSYEKSSRFVSGSAFGEIFEKNFKKKRTRSRRYRRFKGRGPIKKHTLAEKLKRQFKLLKRYGDKSNEKNKKMEILEMITKRKYNPEMAFEARELKQRRTRQSKHRYWKKHKRQKYLQMKRKQRKRRRYSISKLRVLNKEFKRIQAQTEIKKWWWQTFLPNFMSTGDAIWGLERNKQIKKELESLSVSEILAQDSNMTRFGKENAFLQIGDKDFKPLALPQALRLKESLVNEGKLDFGEFRLFGINEAEDWATPRSSFSSDNLSASAKLLRSNTGTDQTMPRPKENQLPNDLQSTEESRLEIKDSMASSEAKKEIGFNRQFKTATQKTDLFSDFTQTLYGENQIKNLDSLSASLPKTVGFASHNPMPFYAGWDENLRQFVITNRLLSRQDAGYVMNFQKETLLNSQTSTLLEKENLTNKLNFNKAPLQGMNAATTLYWQIPFTTYDPDQFFALGMDGFSPLGWRFFNFKHSQETTKPMLVQNIVYTNSENIKDQSLLSYNIQLKMFDVNLKTSQKAQTGEISKNNRILKNQSRKIQKRQKRVKKHPRPPVWFPSGPLTNQVLPVHYIYVFYKRTRLPRDRYLGRRFRRTEDPKAVFIQSNFPKLMDFTLRKRVKPIRKYHRKRKISNNQETSLVIRRRSFKTLMEEPMRFRPLTKTKLNTQTDLLNSSLLKTKQRKRNLNTKPNAENLRIRQLRRRVQRQVLRPVARYKPRPGGFVWPGDYLRLETVKAPTLKNNLNSAYGGAESEAKSLELKNTGNTQIRKKKRRAIQEWQVQPKKYLLHKHNLKVLKKRLQQSQNFNLSSQKLKTLQLML